MATKSKRKAKPVTEPKLSKDAIETIRDYVRHRVRSGYDSLADVTRAISTLDPQELFADDEGTPKQIRTAALEILDHEVAALAKEAKKWPKQTDNDKLDAAFAELESNYAILARQDYWCCQTCGHSAIGDEMTASKKAKRTKKKKPGALGYVFFHNQDTESAVDNAGLYLAYGSAEGVDAHTRSIGKVIVSVLQEHGLPASWDGDISMRIDLPIHWRRRLPKKTIKRD